MKAPKKIYIHKSPHLGLLEASEIDVTGEDIIYTRSDIAELTWEDIKFICELDGNLGEDCGDYMGSQKYYEAMLKKFNEHKK